MSLFRVIEQLKEHGIAIFYISHRLDEIVRIADRVTVMRDGAVIETLGQDEFDESQAGGADGGPPDRQPLPEAALRDRRGGAARRRGNPPGRPAGLLVRRARGRDTRPRRARRRGPHGAGPGGVRGRPDLVRPDRARRPAAAPEITPGRDRRRHRLPDRGPQGRGSRDAALGRAERDAGPRARARHLDRSPGRTPDRAGAPR